MPYCSALASVLLLLLPIGAIYWAITPKSNARSGERIALAGLAMGLGVGFTSCTWFMWLALIGPPGLAYYLCEISLLIFCTTCIRRASSSDSPAVARPELRSLFSKLGIATAILVVGWIVFYGCEVTRHPHGKGDGVAMWNMHARVLYRGAASDAWIDFFKSGKNCAYHPDYPLLIPASIARMWTVSGDSPNFASPAISTLFIVATVLTCAGFVTVLRGRTQGMLSAVALLGTTFFLGLASNQFADIAVGWAMLAAIGCLLLYDNSQSNRVKWLALAGAAAGLAAWTKNEGLLFAVLFAGVWGLRWALGPERRAKLLPTCTLAAGILVPLATVFWFKSCYAPPSEFSEIGTLAVQLVDPSRYGVILPGMFVGLMKATKPLLIPLVVYACVMGRSGETCRGVVLGSSLIALMLCGYTFVYLITPHDLEWHVTWSADRLWLQQWPSILLLTFSWTAPPEERLRSSVSVPKSGCHAQMHRHVAARNTCSPVPASRQ